METPLQIKTATPTQPKSIEIIDRTVNSLFLPNFSLHLFSSLDSLLQKDDSLAALVITPLICGKFGMDRLC
ncbi:hypothetical protein TDB9533_04417 [Thalassocella blandensis]|nr:hypothetical protein TDB9533_04417 [Thalassocella blandensis]